MATSGLVGAQALLVDGERAAHQGLGLAVTVGSLEQQGQVVEGGGVLGMIRAVPNLHCLGVPLGQRDRLAVLPGPIELDHTLIESFQLCVRLSACRARCRY
jgi:hypothetical protein